MRITALNVRPLGIAATTGVHGQNCFALMQFLRKHALDVYRVDGCRPAHSASPAEAG